MSSILSRTLDRWTDSEINEMKRMAILAENRSASRKFVKARVLALSGILLTILLFLGTDPWTENYWLFYEFFSIGIIGYTSGLIAIGYWYLVQIRKTQKLVGL